VKSSQGILSFLLFNQIVLQLHNFVFQVVVVLLLNGNSFLQLIVDLLQILYLCNNIFILQIVSFDEGVLFIDLSLWSIVKHFYRSRFQFSIFFGNLNFSRSDDSCRRFSWIKAAAGSWLKLAWTRFHHSSLTRWGIKIAFGFKNYIVKMTQI
jgi:hypothetical protein